MWCHCKLLHVTQSCFHFEDHFPPQNQASKIVQWQLWLCQFWSLNCGAKIDPRNVNHFLTSWPFVSMCLHINLFCCTFFFNQLNGLCWLAPTHNQNKHARHHRNSCQDEEVPLASQLYWANLYHVLDAGFTEQLAVEVARAKGKVRYL